jgi:hypothetical protein
VLPLPAHWHSQSVLKSALPNNLESSLSTGIYLDFCVDFSTAINVHLQTWSLNGPQVILTKGANLTMTLDKNGLIWDQNGDVCAVSKADGSINFLPPTAVTSDYITGPWSSDSTQGAAISLSGYTAYGCENSTAAAYQMFCFSTTPAQPSCTNVLLQVYFCLVIANSSPSMAMESSRL